MSDVPRPRWSHKTDVPPTFCQIAQELSCLWFSTRKYDTYLRIYFLKSCFSKKPRSDVYDSCEELIIIPGRPVLPRAAATPF
jgi:hypothetical protein